MTIYKEEGSMIYDSLFCKQRWCETQRPPYGAPLRYRMATGRRDKTSPYTGIGIIPLLNGYDRNVGVPEAANSALDKLYEQLGQAESLRTAFAERKSSLTMVTNRIGSLVKMARAVKRLDPKIVRKVLKRNPSAKDIVKQPAGLWLEYWFGWAPLVSDIHHALGVFSYDFPIEPIRCSGGSKTQWKTGGGTYDWVHWRDFKTRVKIGGEIYAIDPNVSLASSLGFGQPLSVAWELTPFSWCVDYVVNVGQLVKNLEPRFPGVRTRNHFTTKYITCSGYSGYRNDEPPEAVPVTTFTSAYMERSLEWPSYSLVFSNPLGLSGQRVSYLAAVFVQIMSGMKKS